MIEECRCFLMSDDERPRLAWLLLLFLSDLDFVRWWREVNEWERWKRWGCKKEGMMARTVPSMAVGRSIDASVVE